MRFEEFRSNVLAQYPDTFDYDIIQAYEHTIPEEEWDYRKEEEEEKPAPQQNTTFFQDTKDLVDTGFYGLAESAGTAGEQILGKGGVSSDLREWGSEGAEEQQEQLTPETRDALNKMGIDPEDEISVRGTAAMFLQSAPMMFGYMIPGAGIAKGLNIAGKAAGILNKASKTGVFEKVLGYGTAGAGLIGGDSASTVGDGLRLMPDKDLYEDPQFQEFYKQTYKGEDPRAEFDAAKDLFIEYAESDSFKKGAAVGFAGSAVAGPLLEKIFRGGMYATRLKNMVAGGVIESGQEIFEEGGQATVEKQYLPETNVPERMVLGGLLGAVGGTAFGGIPTPVKQNSKYPVFDRSTIPEVVTDPDGVGLLSEEENTTFLSPTDTKPPPPGGGTTAQDLPLDEIDEMFAEARAKQNIPPPNPIQDLIDNGTVKPTTLDNLEAMDYFHLRAKAKEAGVSTKGNKEQVIEQIRAQQEVTVNTEPTAILSEPDTINMQGAQEVTAQLFTPSESEEDTTVKNRPAAQAKTAQEFEEIIESFDGNGYATSRVEDWGKMQRGQGKRVGGMVRGSMSDASRGKKTYTDPIGKLPEAERQDVIDLVLDDNRLKLFYLKAKNAGLDHETSLDYMLKEEFKGGMNEVFERYQKRSNKVPTQTAPEVETEVVDTQETQLPKKDVQTNKETPTFYVRNGKENRVEKVAPKKELHLKDYGIDVVIHNSIDGKGFTASEKTTGLSLGTSHYKSVLAATRGVKKTLKDKGKSKEELQSLIKREFKKHNQQLLKDEFNGIKTQPKNNDTLRSEVIDGIKVYEGYHPRSQQKTWFTQNANNVGTENTSGDSIHDNKEDAIATAKAEALDIKSKQKAKVQAEQQEKEQVAQKERDDSMEDYRGFAADKSAMVKARARKTLSVKQRVGLKTLSRKEFIEQKIKDGYTVETVETQDNKAERKLKQEIDYLIKQGYANFGNQEHPKAKRYNEISKLLEDGVKTKVKRLTAKDGSFYEATKTEMDYAEHLIQQSGLYVPKGKKEHTPVPYPTQTARATFSNPSKIDMKGEQEVTAQLDSVTTDLTSEQVEKDITDNKQELTQEEIHKPVKEDIKDSGQAVKSQFSTTERKFSYDKLLNDIDEAIKTSQKNPENTLETIQINVAGDGKFRIKHSPERLAKFKKQVIKEKTAFIGNARRSKRSSKIKPKDTSMQTLEEMAKDGEQENVYYFSKAINKKQIFIEPRDSKVEPVSMIVYKETNVNGLDVVVGKIVGETEFKVIEPITGKMVGQYAAKNIKTAIEHAKNEMDVVKDKPQFKSMLENINNGKTENQQERLQKSWMKYYQIDESEIANEKQTQKKTEKENPVQTTTEETGAKQQGSQDGAGTGETRSDLSVEKPLSTEVKKTPGDPAIKLKRLVVETESVNNGEVTLEHTAYSLSQSIQARYNNVIELKRCIG